MWLMILSVLLQFLPLLLKWLLALNGEGKQLSARQADKLNKVLWYMARIQPEAVRAGCVPGGTPDPDWELQSSEPLE